MRATASNIASANAIRIASNIAGNIAINIAINMASNIASNISSNISSNIALSFKISLKTQLGYKWTDARTDEGTGGLFELLLQLKTDQEKEDIAAFANLDPAFKIYL